MPIDWESEFSKITDGVELTPSLEQPEELPIGIFEVNQAIFGLNEASIFLSQFITQSILDDDLEFPEELRMALKIIDVTTTQVSETLSAYLEKECRCDECIAEKMLEDEQQAEEEEGDEDE